MRITLEFSVPISYFRSIAFGEFMIVINQIITLMGVNFIRLTYSKD